MKNARGAGGLVKRVALVIGAIAMVSGCSSNSDDDDCEDGTPGCKCYGNGTCNAGMSCGPTGICGGGSSSGTGGSGPGPQGSFIETCNSDPTCWYMGNLQPSTSLRTVGGACVLKAPDPYVLRPDGHTDSEKYPDWRITEDGTFIMCWANSNICPYTCRPDANISYPCSGSGFLYCEDVPVEVCPNAAGCSVIGGECIGNSITCNTLFSEAECLSRGCTWSP